MNINRIVPDLHSLRLEESKGFYADFLGLSLQMDMGWVLTFVSTSNRTAQITILKATDYGIPLPHVSIEVEDVVKLHTEALSRGLEIVYPLTEEPWGVRRFFVRDPSGYVVNVMTHLQSMKA